MRRSGRRSAFGTLRAFVLPTRAGRVRVGISVPATVGPAVVRNLVRRRVQGALDALPSAKRPGGADIVFILAPPAAAAGYAGLARDVERAVAPLCAAAAPREAGQA